MIEISKNINKAIEVLQKGDIIGFPTETVYGLAGNIFCETAIQKIFDVKNRPSFNPLIVHIKDIFELDHVAINIPKNAMLLADAFWPGPLTLLLEKNANIPDSITAGKKTVAVRIPNHPMALELLRQLDFPLAAPSANPFGRISPTCAQHVADYFPADLEIVLDGGECKNGLESTIIGFNNDNIIVYRLGAIAIEEIEKIVGKTSLRNKDEKSPEAPGMIGKHYAPRTKTVFISSDTVDFESYAEQKIGILSISKTYRHAKIFHCEILSENENYDEAAKNLYQAMHRLDALNLDLILVERFENINLGRAINDRLERATK